jgi:choline kinase
LYVKAVILSAGQGRRLLPLTVERPKCLVPVAGRTILEWQIRGLAANGVHEIVAVTGFGAEAVEQMLAGLDVPGTHVRTLFNPFYPVSDNLASCFLARGEMTDEFVLLNGDTLFEPRVLGRVLAHAMDPINVTIDRKSRYDDDDMKVSASGRRLDRIGKNLAAHTVNGESIGLLLFRAAGAARFVDGVDLAMRRPEGLRSWFLSVIDALAQSTEVGVISVEGLRWAEIDFPSDLRGAEFVVQDWEAAAAMARGAAASV